MVSPVHVIGDIHGQLEKLCDLLRGAGLTGRDETWAGADNTLWLIGDLVDHGPDGVGVIELVMGLQEQARGPGGAVHVLIGNHDLLLLAAYHLGTRPVGVFGETFRDVWQESGGVDSDLDRLTPEHVRWLTALPAMMREGDHLLVHGDTLLYTRHGRTIEEVNQAMSGLLQSDSPARWRRMLDEFGEHRVFADPAAGPARAEAFLRRFGGRQIVHGHTPIAKMAGQPAETVREPLLYAGDRCVNVDAGLYLGGPGFVYNLPSLI